MLVRIKDEWLNCEEERDLVFVVVEDRSPRVLIAENRARRFPGELIPQESVQWDMVEIIEE